MCRVCLGCLGCLGSSPAACPLCQWPLCSPECGAEVAHRQECAIFREAGLQPAQETHFIYSLLSVLRVLLLKEDDAAWSRVSGLMDHWDLFSRDQRLVEGLRKLTAFMQNQLGLAWVLEKDVQHCYGVMKTNAMGFEPRGGEGQALYPLASIMSHSCAANLELVGELGMTVAFRAKRKIVKGEELTIRYCSFLQPRYKIQEQVLRDWHFSCACTRCSDPSELGSYFSSLQCSCGGFFCSQVPGGDRRRGGGQDARKHLCSKCGRQADLSLPLAEVDSLSRELAREGYREEMLCALEAIPGCHASHHLRTQVYMASLEEAGGQAGPRLLATRAAAVLRTLGLLDPGCTKLQGRYRGLMLEAQQELLQGCGEELSGAQDRRVVLELARGKVRAARLRSDFCIVTPGGKQIDTVENV